MVDSFCVIAMLPEARDIRATLDTSVDPPRLTTAVQLELITVVLNEPAAKIFMKFAADVGTMAWLRFVAVGPPVVVPAVVVVAIIVWIVCPGSGTPSPNNWI
jgi:hypothetical protein